MKRRILLINPPMCVDQPPRFVSFGIAYVAQELARCHEVELLDVDGHRFSKEEVGARIAASGADIVGVGGLVTVFPYLHWLIPEIRRHKPGAKVILGGPVASSLRELCFERFDIDFAVIGEGEVTARELIEALSDGRPLASVKGIGYRDGGRVVFTATRPLLESLDDVPVIDYGPFPVEKLLRNSGGVLQVHTQRGCPGNCTFCFNAFRVASRRVRYRPVRNVIDEIELFDRRYRVSTFHLAGECILLNKDWIIEFCREVLRRKLRIKYRVTSRADTVDEERLEWLRKSGCMGISLGLETGSEKILRIIKKGVTVERGRQAALLAKKFIPELTIGIILGYAGEDERTLAETVEFCKEIGVRPALYYATPFPGTELWRIGVEKGRIKPDECLMGLDRSDIVSFSVNLTDIPDAELKALIDKARRDIDRHFIAKDIMELTIFKRVFAYLRRNGLRETSRRAVDRLREALG